MRCSSLVSLVLLCVATVTHAESCVSGGCLLGPAPASSSHSRHGPEFLRLMQVKTPPKPSDTNKTPVPTTASDGDDYGPEDAEVVFGETQLKNLKAWVDANKDAILAAEKKLGTTSTEEEWDTAMKTFVLSDDALNKKASSLVQLKSTISQGHQHQVQVQHQQLTPANIQAVSTAALQPIAAGGAGTGLTQRATVYIHCAGGGGNWAMSPWFTFAGGGGVHTEAQMQAYVPVGAGGGNHILTPAGAQQECVNAGFPGLPLEVVLWTRYSPCVVNGGGPGCMATVVRPAHVAFAAAGIGFQVIFQRRWTHRGHFVWHTGDPRGYAGWLLDPPGTLLAGSGPTYGGANTFGLYQVTAGGFYQRWM